MQRHVLLSFAKAEAGVGYFDCLVVTLTDRTWQSWIEQLNLMDTMNQIIQWVSCINMIFMEQKNGRVLGKSGEFFFEGLILKLLTI